jgi:hypothetical protein
MEGKMTDPEEGHAGPIDSNVLVQTGSLHRGDQHRPGRQM